MAQINTDVHQEPVSRENRNDEIPLESLPVLPSYTVGDLQKSFGPTNTGIIGGTTPDEDQKIIKDIFLLVTKHKRRKLWWKCLLFFFLFPIFGVFLPCCMYKRRISQIKRIIEAGICYMIRLEGDQWSRYVQHIQIESKGNMSKSSVRQLLSRKCGHILIGIEGFFLDGMLSMQYENIVIVRTEIVQASNQIDMMLRVWFCRRLVMVPTRNGRVVGNPNNDPFKFDIFLPTDMSTELLSSITDFMQFKSVCRPNFIV
ncbi:unnamed protein product [Adineta ricciae]|uniref:Uncharacterized protein n=1 Tax=Adineta ricciae TaxID=249248 RepID=A0A815QCT4_ADIRI|nr:unnamed protein product [Adineta ricciae]CAF1461524.1 unnamed protein product [Adineta ricciae]